MRVSIVIPAYNEERYISSCLDSLLNQSVPPDEIIVVDNNCRDNTVKVAGKYRQVKIVREKKQGMIFARNRGFDEAAGEIIGRCDADTVLPPNWIETIKYHFSRYRIDGLSCTIGYYDLPYKGPLLANLFFDFLNWIQKGRSSLIGPNMVITRKIWRKIRNDVCLDDRLVHEDIDLSLHIMNNGGRIANDKHVVVAVSARRITGNPLSFFFEYPWRLFKTFRKHRSFGL